MKLSPRKNKPEQKANNASARRAVPGALDFRRILVPIDFSDHSKRALVVAVGLAQKFEAELVLVYVVEPVLYPADLGLGQLMTRSFEPDLAERGRSGLEELARSVVPPTIGVRSFVRTGKPYQEIIHTASDESVDLIVIATHGHTGVEHLLFGSTAEKVVKRAPCPVMMVRPVEQGTLPVKQAR